MPGSSMSVISAYHKNCTCTATQHTTSCFADQCKSIWQATTQCLDDVEEWLPGLRLQQSLLSAAVLVLLMCMSNFLYRNQLPVPYIDAAACLLVESCKLTMGLPVLRCTSNAGSCSRNAPEAWVASNPKGYAQLMPIACSPAVCNCTAHVRIQCQG